MQLPAQAGLSPCQKVQKEEHRQEVRGRGPADGADHSLPSSSGLLEAAAETEHSEQGPGPELPPAPSPEVPKKEDQPQEGHEEDEEAGVPQSQAWGP